ncbi:MAG: hypothetical protein H7067_01230 [Burkholderiales bacterium]|nr:hypothetical protein [Opitutaceae bacterium]
MILAPPFTPHPHLRLNPQLRYLLRRFRFIRRFFVPRIVARHYSACFGRPLPRDNPRTLLEIINWAKAWGDLERYAPFADKHQVRHYIKAVAGEAHLVPLLAVTGRAADLNWAALPSAFVLKTTHGSGWNIIVRDKVSANRAAISTQLDDWLSRSFFLEGLESQYAPIKPRLIVESYLGDPQATPCDYKIFCVHGTPAIIAADYDRHEIQLRSFFDPDWNLQSARDPRFAIKSACPRPAGLAVMLELARKLSRPFPFVRVDFYDIDGAVYVGELTFTPSQGLVGVDPPDFDLLMGLRIDFTAYRRSLDIDPRLLPPAHPPS